MQLEDLQAVLAYYSEKLRRHGPTPAGVDWRDQASQGLRFDQLLALARKPGIESILDIGCGYGALLPFLRARGYAGEYHGIDASADMVRQASTLNTDPAARFTCARLDQLGNGDSADLVFASGVFNVKLDCPPAAWQEAILHNLDRMYALARNGYAFNCLSSYSDADKQVDRLYYGDPMLFFDYCKRNHSKHVALLHDYGLYEFTLIVRKTPT